MAEEGGVRGLHRFSTGGYPAAQRTRIWQQHLSETLFVADYRALNPEGVLSDHAAIGVDAGRMHSFTSNGHIVDLTAPGAQTPPVTAAGPILYFTVVLGGRAMYWSNSTMEIAEPGDMLVYDPSDPFFMSFHDRTRLLMFESRAGSFALAEEWGGRACLRIGTGQTVGRRDELQHIYAGLQYGPGGGAGLAHAVDRAIPMLERAARAAVTPGHYSAAVAFIVDHLTDPELTVQAVADAVHLSPRQLARVFGEHGVSPSRYITDTRMRRAARLLAAGEHTVQEVAAMCGYSSVSHFSRTFTAHSTQSPSAYRARALSTLAQA